jgi:hypothetical protein
MNDQQMHSLLFRSLCSVDNANIVLQNEGYQTPKGNFQSGFRSFRMVLSNGFGCFE